MTDNAINLSRVMRDKEAAPGWYKDDKERGLYLHIGKSSRTYYLIKKVDGKSEKYKIADAEAMPVTIAREEAAKMKADIARGMDPKTKAAEAKRQKTFGEYAAMYLSKAELKPRTRGNYKTVLNMYLLPRFGGKRFAEIRRQDVADMFYSASRPTMANMAVKLLSAIIDRAIDDGYCEEMANPCRRIKRHKARRRERRFTADELRKIIATITAEREYYAPKRRAAADIILMALYTGQRKGNVLTMRWAEVDTARRLWTIPADKAKNGRTTAIYLNDAAAAVLNGAERSGEHVFMQISDRLITYYFQELMQRCGITGAVFHTLRHTHASMLADMGASTAIISKALGHADLSSTAIYTHPDAEAVRDAEDKLAEFFKADT